MRKTLAGIAAAGLVTAGLIAAAPVNPTDVPDNEQVTRLLVETKVIANQLKEDAVTMESFNYMKVSAETQKIAINQIRDHINQLGRQMTKLNEAKPNAAPWQKTAIDRVDPYLGELEGYTLAVIEHLTGAPRHTAAEYEDYLEANADYASDLAAMITNFVDFARAKQRLERLQAKIEVK